MRYIKMSISYITPKPISDIFYTLNDVGQVITFGRFANSDPSLSIVGILLIDGNPANLPFISFDQLAGSITIHQTSDATLVGTH